LDWLTILALGLGVVALAFALIAYVSASASEKLCAETAVKFYRFENEARPALIELKAAVKRLEWLEGEVNYLKQRERKRRDAVEPQAPET
jgi:hypothetical protein